MAKRAGAVHPFVIEGLRLCVVLACLGLGFQLASAPGIGDVAVGPFDSSQVYTVLGAAGGYVLGGVLARLTGRGLEQAEAVLAGRSPEQTLAALAGTVAGVLAAAAVTWPVLLVGTRIVTVPVFLFFCLATGTLGARVAQRQRRGVLAMLGADTRGRTHSTARGPRLVDTSVLVDGRIVDVARAGFLHGSLLVPLPVLTELQGLADAADESRRTKGRRGLDVLEALRRERGLDVEVIGDEAAEVPDVDGKLVRIVLDRRCALLTLDSNLAKVTSLAGGRVMNLHALSLALRPPVSAGDPVAVLLTRAGKESGQAVGYLDDGTMVVVERARERVGHEVTATVTSVLTTANGRMVFAAPSDPARRSRQAPPEEVTAT